MPSALLTGSFANLAFENRAARIAGLHDHYTAAWHGSPALAPVSLAGLEKILVEQHLANFELWHAEDSARTPGVEDRELARIKRLIDVTNQRRNDLIEQFDSQLLASLSEHGLPAAGAELHSETPGLILDRLSILSLKLFHTQVEIDRPGAPPGHAELNRKRLRILEEQRDDLAAALGRLWKQLLAGQRSFKLYRQLKMYNDPALNPSVYSKQS